MKKKLLIVLCLVLAITLTGCGKKSAKIEEKEEKTEKREGNASDDNYVISYKDSDALDQIPTKEVDGIHYKSFSVKTGDDMDIYVIVYNETDETRKYYVVTYGYKDDDKSLNITYDNIAPHDAYLFKIHFNNVDNYSVDSVSSGAGDKVLASDEFKLDKYEYEKKSLKLFYTYNGETLREAKVYIIGMEDGDIIGVGDADMRKVTDEGKVEPDGVITNNGDKAVASFQNIKLNFDLDACDQILYFIN